MLTSPRATTFRLRPNSRARSLPESVGLDALMGCVSTQPTGCQARTPFQVFIDVEEVFDFLQHMGLDAAKVLNSLIARVAVGHGEDLLIESLVVDHIQHSDRAGLYQATGEG